MADRTRSLVQEPDTIAIQYRRLDKPLSKDEITLRISKLSSSQLLEVWNTVRQEQNEQVEYFSSKDMESDSPRRILCDNPALGGRRIATFDISKLDNFTRLKLSKTLKGWERKTSVNSPAVIVRGVSSRVGKKDESSETGYLTNQARLIDFERLQRQSFLVAQDTFEWHLRTRQNLISEQDKYFLTLQFLNKCRLHYRTEKEKLKNDLKTKDCSQISAVGYPLSNSRSLECVLGTGTVPFQGQMDKFAHDIFAKLNNSGNCTGETSEQVSGVSQEADMSYGDISSVHDVDGTFATVKDGIFTLLQSGDGRQNLRQFLASINLDTGSDIKKQPLGEFVPSSTLPKKGRYESCIACRKAKVRCDHKFGLPPMACVHCVERGLHCQYASNIGQKGKLSKKTGDIMYPSCDECKRKRMKCEHFHGVPPACCQRCTQKNLPCRYSTSKWHTAAPE